MREAEVETEYPIALVNWTNEEGGEACTSYVFPRCASSFC